MVRLLGDPPDDFAESVALERRDGESVAAHIMTLAAAWRRVHSSAAPAGDSLEATARFVGTLATEAAFLRDHLSAEPADRAFELEALIEAASAVPAIDENGALLRFATGALDQLRSA